MTYRKKSVNGLSKLSGLNGYAKYLPVLALAAALAALAVSSFCTHTPESCADGQELKPGMFCFDNKAWTKCGGSEYIPYTQFCSAEAVYDKCNGKDDYDPLREFCSGNKVVPKCGGGGEGGVTYNPETQGCVNGIVKSRCGNNHYDSINEFCFNNRIYNKCNGVDFDPMEGNCDGEIVRPKCGTGYYDYETHFCYINVVYPKCDGKEYDPSESFCESGATYPLCGGRKYDPSTQACNGTDIVVIAKCNGLPYDGATNFCHNNSLYPKCGGQDYDPSRQSCNGTNVVDNPSDTPRPKYTVYFNNNGGADGVDPPRSITEDSGKVITLPVQQTMAKDGFSFGGWSANGTNYDAGAPYMVVGAATLYARWIPIHTITFNDNGATGGDAPNAVRADSGKVITLPGRGTMSKNGFSFGWWNTKSDGTGADFRADSAYTVTGNITLYARWVPIYTVAFSGNGTTAGVPGEVRVDSGTVITLPGQGNMVKTNAHFGGWSTSSSGGTNYPAGSSYTVTGNVTLFARWTAYPVYTVTYNGNGATSGSVAAMSVDSGSAAITLPGQGTLVKTGYNFGGWNTNSGGTGTNYNVGASYTVTKNDTLYAKWTVISYTVTFDGNGAASGVPAAVSANSGSSITLPLMTRMWYTFEGWNTESSGTGTNYAAVSSYIVTGNVTLYAKWTVAVVDPSTVVNGTFTDTRNSKTYKTVKIGNQTWMGENLNYQTADSWCYNNSPDSCAKYGMLYTWFVAKTACPAGWHLPSNDEWGTLVDAVGGSSVAGKKLKSQSGWGSSGNGTDDYSFKALPGGGRNPDGSFSYVGYIGDWWAATEYSDGNAYYREIYSSNHSVSVGYYGNDNKESGMTVRCVEND